MLFVNWKVPPFALQDAVPFPLDLHEGCAVLSLVPFFMDQVRFRGLPQVPVASSLWEVNLRTYVRVNGVPGIYFFTLETPHRIANAIARNFFDLPYRYARVSAAVTASEYRMNVNGMFPGGRPYELKLLARSGTEHSSSEFQKWITERYHLFLKRKGSIVRGDVFHDPWKARAAQVLQLEGGISAVSGFPALVNLESCFWADPLRVRFAPFVVLR